MKPIYLPALLAVMSMATYNAAFAQTSNKDEATSPMAQTLQNPSRIDLKIDGMALPDLIDYLGETTGKNIVLLVPPNIDATKIIVPALKLRHVSLEQILELLQQMPGTELSFDASGEGDSQIYSISVECVDEPPTPPQPPFAPGAPGAPFPTEPFGGIGFGGYPSGPTEPFLSVLPLTRMILGNSPEERVPDEGKRKEMLDSRTKQALTLIDQAFQMTPQGEAKPEIKLHAETNTLLVKATPRQLQTINQVLSAMEVPGPSDSRKDFERKLQEVAMQGDRSRAQLQEEMSHKEKMMEEQFARIAQERAELAKQREELRVEIEQLKAQLAARDAQKPQ